jgi:hypothetical protein
MASPGTLFLCILAKTLRHTAAPGAFHRWICIYNFIDTFAVGFFHAACWRKRVFWKAISLHFRSAGCSVAPKFARVLRSNRQIKSGRCGVRVWRQQRNTLISWSWRSRLELELESEQFVIFETLHKFVSFGRCTDGQAGSKDYGRRLGKPSGWTAWALQPAALFQSRFASPNLTFHCSPIFFHLSQPWRWWWDVPRSPRITLSHSAVVQGLSIKCHIMLPFCDCQWGLCVHFRQHLGPLHYSAQMINWHKVRILEDCLQMTDCPICLLLTSVTPKQWQEVTPIMGNSKTWPFYPFSIAI